MGLLAALAIEVEVAELIAEGFVSPIIEAIELNISAGSAKSDRIVDATAADEDAVDEDAVEEDAVEEDAVEAG